MNFSGQGPIYMGDYNETTGKIENGYIVSAKKIGCANRTLKTSFSQEITKIKESCSGQSLTMATFETGKEATVSLEMADFDREMLATAMYGTSALVTGSTVTGETFPTVAVGDTVHTKHPKISSVVVKDSAGTPATLVLGTDYTMDSSDHGRINILNIGAYVQPFKADYTFASYGNLTAFTSTSVVKGLIFDFINRVDGTKGRVIIPKIKFSPTSEFNWLSDEEAVLSLEGEILYSAALTGDGTYGSFMRIDGIE